MLLGVRLTEGARPAPPSQRGPPSVQSAGGRSARGGGASFPAGALRPWASVGALREQECAVCYSLCPGKCELDTKIDYF